MFRVILYRSSISTNLYQITKHYNAEPCASNFTRVGSGCYYFSTDAINWKNANYACRKLKGNLLELDADDEKRHLFANLLSDNRLKGASNYVVSILFSALRPKYFAGALIVSVLLIMYFNNAGQCDTSGMF